MANSSPGAVPGAAFQALSRPRLPVWTQVAEIKGTGELPGLIDWAKQAGSPFRSETVGGEVSA